MSDGSTDDTEAAVRSYRDPRVHLLVLSEKSGHPSAPRNKGLERARGQGICYLDHDHAFEPQHLTTLRSVYEEKGVQVVATAAHLLTPTLMSFMALPCSIYSGTASFRR
ncbi:glycosyltransferase family 2 protein [Corynebacterium sp. TAE3-ERU12]|uniref:glycosyltransferase family 2 protein n=1 Tax=Corynebacterium sp. TAE3-ERU12 TaxID=2849491 RepID=UPI00351CF4C4